MLALGSGFSASPTMLCRVGVAEVDPNPNPNQPQPHPYPITLSLTPTPNPNPSPTPNPNLEPNPNPNPHQTAASLADDGRVRCFAPSLAAAAALTSERISLTAAAVTPYLGGTATVRGGANPNPNPNP